MNDSHLSKLQELEAALLAHPGVREAAAIFRQDGSRGKPNLVACIVPDENYISQALADPENQRKRLHNRRKTFDLAQLGKQAGASEPGFNIAGWDSSYTRTPIPAHQIREGPVLTVPDRSSFQPQSCSCIACCTPL